MKSRTVHGCLALALAVVAVGGCGSPRRAVAKVAHVPRARTAARTIYWTSPSDAVRAFAEAFINWTPATVEVDLQELALVSRGAAHAEMAQEAEHVAGDYELQRGGIANQGEVESVADLPGQRGRYVVVTLERTTATDARAYQDLPPAWHVIVAGTVEVLPGQWTVSTWQEES